MGEVGCKLLERKDENRTNDESESHENVAHEEKECYLNRVMRTNHGNRAAARRSAVRKF